jgi:hypothetical protein
MSAATSGLRARKLTPEGQGYARACYQKITDRIVRELEARRQTASRDRTVPNIARAEIFFRYRPIACFRLILPARARVRLS